MAVVLERSIAGSQKGSSLIKLSIPQERSSTEPGIRTWIVAIVAFRFQRPKIRSRGCRERVRNLTCRKRVEIGENLVAHVGVSQRVTSPVVACAQERASAKTSVATMSRLSLAHA